LEHSEIIGLLQSYFSGLPEKEANLIMSISKYQYFEPKDILQKSGASDRSIFLILKGDARSYALVNGVEKNCHIRSEGFLLGDARSFAEDPTTNLTTEAITECHVLKFRQDDFEKLAKTNSILLNLYLKLLKEIIVTLSHRLTTFVTMSSQDRYLDLIRWNPNYLQNTYDKHLASFLGITPLTYHRLKSKSSKN
jgi:CRP-like cAMP-binding protein